MTKKQFAIALVVLLIGGVLGGTLVRGARPAQAAERQRPALTRPRIRVQSITVKPRYFTSTMMMGVMTKDDGYKQLPCLVVWRYARNAGTASTRVQAQARSLRQVRMARAPQDLVSGKPTEWEYVPLSAPGEDQVLLYRYRIYEPSGGAPVAEYEYLGRDSPTFNGLGDYPGMPEE